MNHIFTPHLRKFMLVFFDDILVYSPNLDQHLIHLTKAFEILKAINFMWKGLSVILQKLGLEYLGHIITGQGVSSDPQKVAAMEH